MAHVARVDLDTLIRELRTYQPRATKDGGAWSPIVWGECEECPEKEPVGAEHCGRDDSSVESVCALVYDLDHPTPEGMLTTSENLARLNWVWILHETYTAGRYRLIIPLASDVSADRYARVWEAARAALGVEADVACRDLGRLSYLPAHPPGETRDSDTGGTTLCDPTTLESYDIPVALKERPGSSASAESGGNSVSVPEPIPENFDLDSIRAAVSNIGGPHRKALLDALSWKLRLPKGHREVPLHNLTSALTAVLPQEEMGAAWQVVKVVFGHVVDTMVDPTLSPEEYMAKVRYSFERAWDFRENRDAQREAALKFFQPEPDSPTEWRSHLITNVGKDGEPTSARACTANLDLILEYDEEFRGHVRFNDLRRRVEITGGALQAPRGSGTTALAFSNWLQRSEYSMHVERATCGASVLHAAKRRHFNPVEQYLLSLKWDGKPRCARVLLDHCEAMGNESYIADITRKFFIAAAARGLDAGCKVDTVLVLQGRQGSRKTSFVETMAGEWYTTVGNKIIDKDTQMQATEAWFVELSELASMSPATLHSLRGYLTKRVDQIRVPYAESHEDYPRRCVFVGTTNEDQPLMDPDGNRRWWVVSCGEIDLRALKRNRDQLWAEAVHMFREYQKEMEADVPEAEMEYRWWFTRPEQDDADIENSIFMQDNPIEDDIDMWLRTPKQKPRYVTPAQLAKMALHIPSERLAQEPGIVLAVTKTLAKLKWVRRRMGTDPRRYWAFEVPSASSEETSETDTQPLTEAVG